MEKMRKKIFYVIFFKISMPKTLFGHILEKIQQKCWPAKELPAGCARGCMY
jgi:hypothetical protein